MTLYSMYFLNMAPLSYFFMISEYNIDNVNGYS